MTLAAAHDQLPAQRGGAKAMLLTVLGEFVLPAGGQAWTSSLVAAADVLGIGEKNARQAIARIGDEGLLEARRHGRRVRWSLTPSGRSLLESGTQRIYSFGVSDVDWQGAWLVAHCPVAEAMRAVRTQLRTQLGFLGFGELSASLLVSPHVGRETQLRAVLADLGLLDDCVILRSTLGSVDEDANLVTRAWDLDDLSATYASFERAHAPCHADTPEASFGAVTALVHDWRRFPFIDPELPTELLPDPWAGTAAAKTFHECHAAWSPAAQRWFREMEAGESPPPRPNG